MVKGLLDACICFGITFVLHNKLTVSKKLFVGHRRSVEYRRKNSTPKSQLLEERIQSNPERIQSNPEHLQRSATSAQGSAVDIQKYTDSAQECAEGVTALRLSSWKPMYLLTPVDRYGDSIGGVSYLADEGTCTA